VSGQGDEAGHSALPATAADNGEDRNASLSQMSSLPAHIVRDAAAMIAQRMPTTPSDRVAGRVPEVPNGHETDGWRDGFVACCDDGI